MVWRIVASLSFIAGGVFTWFVLAFLYAFADSQAGLSASSGPGFRSADAWLPWLACS